MITQRPNHTFSSPIIEVTFLSKSEDMKNISAPTASQNASPSTTQPATEELFSKAEVIAWCSAFAMETFFIVVGNLLTIVVFAFNKKLRKKTLFLAINMAFADLLLGSVCLPIAIYFLVARKQPLNSRSYTSFNIILVVFSQASVISATLMSGERFYAVYWPLKHRTLSTRAYLIIIFMVWTFAILGSIIFLLPSSSMPAIYAVMCLYGLLLLLCVCALNIGIWRKFQDGKMTSHQQNRVSQNHRLTKTLLFVSIIALSSWLPSIIYYILIGFLEFSVPLNISYATFFLFFCNSFVNPIWYALRIPEFKRSLGSCFFRRQAVINRGGDKGRDNRAVALTPVTQLRTLPTDLSHQQLAFEQQVIDTNF